MSEKNGEIAKDCLVTYLDPGPHDNLVTVWRLETIDRIGRTLHQKDSDHEALIGVLVDGLTEIKEKGRGDCGCGYCSANTLLHPLVQEYLKKEKI